MKGKITICRTEGQKGSWMSLTVVDEASGVQFVDIKIEMEAFAYLLSGLARQECEFELRNAENVGKKKWSKTVQVPLPDATGKEEFIKEVKRSLEDGNFLVGGWRVNDYECESNSHRKNYTKKLFSVTIYKYEDVP